MILSNNKSNLFLKEMILILSFFSCYKQSNSLPYKRFCRIFDRNPMKSIYYNGICHSIFSQRCFILPAVNFLEQVKILTTYVEEHFFLALPALCFLCTSSAPWVWLQFSIQEIVYMTSFCVILRATLQIRHFQ